MPDEIPEDRPKRKVPPLKAIAPIAMMVLLFIVTIGLALFIAPLYLRQGLQAFGEENASNPWIALYYLVMIIIVTAIVLVLKRFLKKRKRRFLKYLLGAAVLLSTYAVIWPLMTAAVHGLPPEWEEKDIGVEGLTDAIPPDILVFERSLGILEGDMEVRTVLSDNASTFSVLGPNVVQRNGNGTIGIWTRAGDSLRQFWVFPISDDEKPTSLDLAEVEGMGIGPLFRTSSGNGSRILFLPQNSSDPIEVNGSGSMEFIFWSGMAYSGTEIVGYSIEGSGTNLTIRERPLTDLNETILWARNIEDAIHKEGMSEDLLLVSTDKGLWLIGPGDHTSKISRRVFNDPSLVSFASDGSEWEIAAIRGRNLHIIDQGSSETWYLTDDDYIMVQMDPPGRITLVTADRIEMGGLPKVYDSTPLHLASFLISSGLVVVLFWKPKWYVVDLAGILMGAGVLSLIGISLSILPILLLLVLLAVYDFISVYKTKHMLSLAESVVESKLPILLVFPMKASYRYEDEKDLLDKNRPREALFMGLGDVIIPGTLIVSASTFLSGRDGMGLLGLGPEYTVVLFAMMGLFVGYAGLMYMVLKGKAHAGLPFLNGGAITGFLLGELIAFGTIVIV